MSLERQIYIIRLVHLVFSCRILCQSGDAGSASRTGVVRLKFGSHGPHIQSNQTVSYLSPTITKIEPLVGIESGGTLLTIHGENLTIGNGLVIVSIDNRPCQLLSLSRSKIQCETTAFSPLISEERSPITFHFDRQTTLIADKGFRVVPNPVLHSFDGKNPFQSFLSGGHQLLVRGENFHPVQNIRLEFKRTIFVSPLFHNETHLIFLSPSLQELHLNDDDDYQQGIEMIIHLDHFNQSSILTFLHDPLIYELEPMLQTYTNELTIHGVNLTAAGHTAKDVLVHIGCDLCPVLQLQSDKLICQPPLYRPKKYSKNNRLCYDSEHPWIIVTMDNIHSHVGYMLYPKRLIVLGIITGCLVTILLVILIVLIVVCIRIRCNQQKSRRRYLYGAGLKHPPAGKEPYHETLRSRTYQKLQAVESTMTDSSPLSTIPIRSYINHLQLCYYYDLHDHSSSYDIPKLIFKPELIDQFQSLVGNHDDFLQCFVEILLKSKNRKLLATLLLTQRYQLKRFLQFNHDWIYFHICLLTAYDGFLSNQITALLYQLYHQLKLKIHSGPIDSIEQTSSYYSLNNQTILHDQSILFNSIQIIVHIDCQTADDLLLINVTCLTCDTISQVKAKILHQFQLYQTVSQTPLDECHLYLLTTSKANTHSCSTSSCSSSTASSSNLPVRKKSMITQFFFNRSMKYSTTTTTTTTLNDSYRDSSLLLLNDIDSTNEQTNHCKKLNTLQHYGILTDGYELKILLPKKTNHSPHLGNFSSSSIHQPYFLHFLARTLRPNCFDCQYCALDREKLFTYLTSLPITSIGTRFPSMEDDHTRYFHLLNHTYEEIGECGHLLMDNNQSETYRLFETKSLIHPILINLIETLFTKFLHSDSYLSELIEQHSRFLHIFYGHLVPFLLKNLICLFDMTIDPCLKSSFDILATIFQIACSSPLTDQRCQLCLESATTETNLTAVSRRSGKNLLLMFSRCRTRRIVHCCLPMRSSAFDCTTPMWNGG